MKILFIGGSGNISSACTRAALEKGYTVYHLNRGKTTFEVIPGVTMLTADIHVPGQTEKAIAGLKFDVVANFIGFTAADVQRDIDLFAGKTGQYIYISSASAYQKPLAYPFVTESTPLKNPYWDYSRDKIAAEETLLQAYRDIDFPVTIIRPSLTYQYVIPLAIGGWDDYGIIDRMRKGLPVIVHGDGSSLWTITHSEDFAKGFAGLLGHQQAIGQAFHITSDEVLTWNQIYEAVAAAIGVKANIVHISSDFICDAAEALGQGWMRGSLLGDKSCSVIFDNSKIKSFVPGYSARIPFSEGIKRTIAWFEADPGRMNINEDNNKFIDSIISSYKNR